METLRLSYRRARSQGGAAALEAILSIMMLFGFFYCMWGLAIVIYNQSRISTATQFAAQGALTIYDRSTYRGIGTAGEQAVAQQRADDVARSLFRENLSGLAKDQFTGDIPTTTLAGDSAAVECAPSISGPYSISNCSGQASHTASRAVRVTVNASATGTFWLLSPLQNGKTDDDDQRLVLMRGRAQAFSYSPD